MIGQRTHRDDAKRMAIGVLTIVFGVVIAYIGLTTQLGGNLPGKRYTEVRAAFADVGPLKKNEEVSQNGVHVGQISNIAYKDGEALVTLRLDGRRTVYADATAKIGSESTFGRKYVDLNPGTPTSGTIGDRVIPSSRTTDAQDLDQVLRAFPPRSREGLRTVLQQVGGGALGHGGDLNDFVLSSPQLLADMATTLNATTSQQAQLAQLLASARTLSARFDGREAELAGLLRSSSTTLDAFAVDDAAPLSAALKKLPATLTTARAGLAKITPPLEDLGVATRQLTPGATALGNATPALRQFLRDVRTPLSKVPDISAQARPVVVDLTDVLTRLRPLATRLRTTLSTGGALLDDLRPFIPDAGRMFANYELLLGSYAPDKHYFSAELATPGLYSAGLPDPLLDFDPYPGPGRAWGPRGGGR